MATNKSAKLDEALDRRVQLAMKATNTEIFADIVRRALTRECRIVEKELREINPTEYRLIYGDESYYQPPGK